MDKKEPLVCKDLKPKINIFVDILHIMELNRAYEIKGWMSEELIHSQGKFKKSYYMVEGLGYGDVMGAVNSINSINGIGIRMNEDKNYAIKVFCSRPVRINLKTISNYFKVPLSDITLSNIGEIKTQRTNRHRPAFAGISIGHYKVSAGTFGCVVKDNSRYYILSNNHVLANSNDCSIGDPILQPGRIDGGKNKNNLIGKLSYFMPLDFRGINQIDAAISEPFDYSHISAHIPNIGSINGITNPRIGMRVVKYGRTTGYRVGVITSRNADIKVNFGGQQVQFEDQFEIQGFTNDQGRKIPFSRGGDSGSLIVEYGTNLAVGLLFAGNDTKGVTFANPINKVLSTFDVTIV